MADFTEFDVQETEIRRGIDFCAPPTATVKAAQLSWAPRFVSPVRVIVDSIGQIIHSGEARGADRRHIPGAEWAYKPRGEPMKLTQRILTVALVSAAAASNKAFADETTRGPTEEAASQAPGPEHARLTALCGTWDLEMIFWFQPASPGVATKGTSTIRPLFGGLFIEEKIEGALNGTAFTTLSWTGFNTATRQYEATRIASTNTIRIAETGAWDEKVSHFELTGSYFLAGDTWTQRTVIQRTSADAMVVASYLRFGNVPEWKAVEIKYRRSSK